MSSASQNPSRPAGNAGPLAECQTDRLYMRAVQAEDEHLFCALFTDAQTMRFIGPPWPLARARRNFRRLLQAVRSTGSTQLFFTLVEKTSGQAIGICTLQKVDALQRRVEIGIMLEPTSCSRGFAKEALARLTAHAFTVLPIDTVWAHVANDHAAIHRILRGIGFSRGDTASLHANPHLSMWSVDRRRWLG